MEQTSREIEIFKRDCAGDLESMWNKLSITNSEQAGSVALMEELVTNTVQQCQVLKHDVDSILRELGVEERAQLQQEVAKVVLLMTANSQEIEKIRMDVTVELQHLFGSTSHSDLEQQARLAALSRDIKRQNTVVDRKLEHLEDSALNAASVEQVRAMLENLNKQG